MCMYSFANALWHSSKVLLCTFSFSFFSSENKCMAISYFWSLIHYCLHHDDWTVFVSFVLAMARSVHLSIKCFPSPLRKLHSLLFVLESSFKHSTKPYTESLLSAVLLFLDFYNTISGKICSDLSCKRPGTVQPLGKAAVPHQLEASHWQTSFSISNTAK